MAKERVDVLAYKQGPFDTREQAKRGVMAVLSLPLSMVSASINRVKKLMKQPS